MSRIETKLVRPTAFVYEDLETMNLAAQEEAMAASLSEKLLDTITDREPDYDVEQDDQTVWDSPFEQDDNDLHDPSYFPEPIIGSADEEFELVGSRIVDETDDEQFDTLVEPVIIDVEVPNDAEIVELVEEVIVTTADQIIEYEPDMLKRDQLRAYVQTLSPDDQLVLLDTYRAIMGPSPSINAVDESIKDIISMARMSKLLKAKQHSTHMRMNDFLKLSQQVQRMVNGSFRDDTINSLRIDSTVEHINMLEETVSILSTAIYDLASRVGMERYNEPENMPVNIENLIRVCATVGHGAKGWAIAAEHGKANAMRNKLTIESMQKRIEELYVINADLRAETEKRKTTELSGVISSSSFYYIMNYSGFYIGTDREPDEDGDMVVTRKSAILTHDVEKAIPLSTIEDARALYDSLQYWYDNFPSFRDKFKQSNVRFDTLFMAQTLVRKVEG